MITTYERFLLEAQLRDISLDVSTGKPVPVDDYKRSNFLRNEKLIPLVHLDDFDKDIHVVWNHRPDHDLYGKISERTSLRSVSEFNELFVNVLEDLFAGHFDELVPEATTYDIELTESRFHILMDVDHENLFEDHTEIFVVTFLTAEAPKYDVGIELGL